MLQNGQNFFKVFIFLSRYLKKNILKFISFYLGWLIQSLMIVITPLIFGTMVDEIIYYDNKRTFMEIAALFVVITIWSSILYYFIYEIYARLVVTFKGLIKVDVLDGILRSNTFYLIQTKTGELMACIQEYADECMNFVVRNFIHNTNGIFLIITTLGYIIQKNLLVGILALLIIPINIMISLGFGKKVRAYGNQIRDSKVELANWVIEMFRGALDLRLLGCDRHIRKNFVNKQKKIFTETNMAMFNSQIALSAIEGTNLIIQMTVHAVLGWWAYKQGVSVGDVIIILAYIALLLKESKAVCTKYMDGQKRLGNIITLADLVYLDNEEAGFGNKELSLQSGTIDFKNVTFSYHTDKVDIVNLNLHINAGEKVAIVGESGAGKSTLAYLLAGFYVPQNGGIYIDGQNLCDCTLNSIRNNIGFVQQNVLIYDGTIRENILLGNLEATESEIMNACIYAGLKSLISTLPLGLDTIIGKDGLSLSGGEKQRIALARIFIKRTAIFIFDEATAALDSDTEKVINETLKDIYAGKTMIIITHRHSAVMMCDKVVLLSNGQIEQVGTPEEMLKNKKFNNLFAITE